MIKLMTSLAHFSFYRRNVYATFAGPWSDVSCRVQDMDTKVTFERQFDLAVLSFLFFNQLLS